MSIFLLIKINNCRAKAGREEESQLKVDVQHMLGDDFSN